MTTSVRGTGRGAATVQRTSVTVSSPVSVLMSSHMPPPSTNRSMRPVSRIGTRSASRTSCASTMRHTLLVSEAISRTRPVPLSVASTWTSGTVVQRCQ